MGVTHAGVGLRSFTLRNFIEESIIIIVLVHGVIAKLYASQLH